MIQYNKETKTFTQIEGNDERACFICGSKKFVDYHHYDLHHGKYDERTVPLCRRCHHTIHMSRGIHQFDDDKLDKAIIVWNITQEILHRQLITRADIKRSKYWIKTHENNNEIKFDPVSKLFSQT